MFELETRYKARQRVAEALLIYGVLEDILLLLISSLLRL